MAREIKDKNSCILKVNDTIIYEGKSYRKKLEISKISGSKIYGLDIDNGNMYSFNATKNRAKISLYESNRKISYTNLIALIESTESNSIF